MKKTSAAVLLKLPCLSAHQKRVYAITVLLAGILVGAFTLSETLQAAMKTPKDFTMTLTGNMPHVIFSHRNHTEAQNLTCQDCHTKIFQMKIAETAKKNGPLTMAAMEDGKFCGACHNGKKSFGVKAENTCAKCHVEK
jgi:c(7)-type cytochrome triheme protein